MAQAVERQTDTGFDGAERKAGFLGKLAVAEIAVKGALYNGSLFFRERGDGLAEPFGFLLKRERLFLIGLGLGPPR